MQTTVQATCAGLEVKGEDITRLRTDGQTETAGTTRAAQ